MDGVSAFSCLTWLLDLGQGGLKGGFGRKGLLDSQLVSEIPTIQEQFSWFDGCHCADDFPDFFAWSIDS